MPYVLRKNTLPPLSQIVALPQIVIVDQTGPAVTVGTSPGATCLVGEFVKGGFVPFEVTSGAQVASLYGGIDPFLSQDGSSPPIQNGAQVGWNGNGALQLKSKSFRRLVLQRVNMECVTTDGGTTASPLTITITVGTPDQTAGKTNKDILVPAGTMAGDNALFASATKVVKTSQDLTIPAGTTVTANQVSATVNVFFVKTPEPVASVPIAAVNVPMATALPNVDVTTIIATVNNAAALWPPGVGTTLALRTEFQYGLAINATLPSASPMSDITVIWAARRSTAVRAALAANVTAASQTGRGRMCCVSGEPAAGASPTQAAAGITAVEALTTNETVLASDRVAISWPHTTILVPELGNITALINPDGWMATTLSNFAEEVNPGAANDFMQPIVSLEPAYTANPLAYQDYANLQAAGICGIIHDRSEGWWFSNGVTGVNPIANPTRVPIKRRRMADLIQDTIAQIAGPYLKQPATIDRVDAFVSQIEEFLNTLLSINNPAAQRIQAFSVDAVSANTPALEAIGIFTILVYVTLLASMDDIVLQTQIGETVVVPVQQAA